MVPMPSYKAHSIQRWLWIGSVLFWCCFPMLLYADVIDRLQPGEWYEVPHSKLRAVVPTPPPFGSYAAMMNAWSGGAYDTKRDRLIIWGGGHGDYAGNELYAFDLQTLTWLRLWGPTPNAMIPPQPAPADEVYLDGTLIATVSSTSYTDSDLSPGTVYTYRIVAYDAAGQRSMPARSIAIKVPTGTTPVVSSSQPPSPSEAPKTASLTAPTQVTATATTPSQVTLTWSAATSAAGGITYKIFRDGSPVSRHTYDGLEYLPNIDRFWAHGGSLWSGSGAFGIGTWLFDFETLRWTRRTDAPDGPRMSYAAYDPVTGHVFVQRGPTLWEYDPVADTWTRRGSYKQSVGITGTAALDPKRRKFVIIGDGKVFSYDMTTPPPWVLTPLTTTGDTAILTGTTPEGKSYRPGLEYDPISDTLVAWHGGVYVYTLNLDTLAWKRHAPAATNTVIPTMGPGQGTFGRFRYVPSKNVFIAVNSINENVYIYRLTAQVPLPQDTLSSPSSRKR